jgi:CRP-like cAMP-binding protein
MAAALTAPEMELVRQTPMFRGLAPDAFRDVINDCMVECRASGEALFSQGDVAQSFFVLLDGWVKVYRVTYSGDEAVIGIFTKGQAFAEAVAIVAGEYPATGETITPTRLIRVPCDRLRSRIRAKPDIALSMIASTAQHLQLLVRQIEQLKAQTGAQRVAEFLLSLADTEKGAATIALPYDKSLIAARLGMKPESLSRSFARLRPLGLNVNGAKVTINDVQSLRYTVLEDDGEIFAE